ncbi:hypothetical protein CB1_000726038 [Camelus ferus]|nr:hypothetical protein CB1_000726038 [Camelus ferus]
MARTLQHQGPQRSAQPPLKTGITTKSSLTPRASPPCSSGKPLPSLVTGDSSPPRGLCLLLLTCKYRIHQGSLSAQKPRLSPAAARIPTGLQSAWPGTLVPATLDSFCAGGSGGGAGLSELQLHQSAEFRGFDTQLSRNRVLVPEGRRAETFLSRGKAGDGKEKAPEGTWQCPGILALSSVLLVSIQMDHLLCLVVWSQHSGDTAAVTPRSQVTNRSQEDAASPATSLPQAPPPQDTHTVRTAPGLPALSTQVPVRRHRLCPAGPLAAQSTPGEMAAQEGGLFSLFAAGGFYSNVFYRNPPNPLQQRNENGAQCARALSPGTDSAL